jgi:hypothetical protein
VFDALLLLFLVWSSFSAVVIPVDDEDVLVVAIVVFWEITRTIRKRMRRYL